MQTAVNPGFLRISVVNKGGGGPRSGPPSACIISVYSYLTVMYSQSSIKPQLDPAVQEHITPQYCLDFGHSIACQGIGRLLDWPQRFIDIKHLISSVPVQYKTFDCWLHSKASSTKLTHSCNC